ncbi:MAG: ThuA domain-containing protein [Croceibacterium sp.]
MKRLFAALAIVLLPAPAAAQDPHWPAPTFDSEAPELPQLERPAVLIVSKTNGFRHDSIAEAVPAIERLAAARGWDSFATENAAVFHAAQLARFDLVVFASASGELFTPDQAAAFQAWVAEGNGFVALHATGDASLPDWFDAMIGGAKFIGHPNGEDQFQAGDLVVENPNHPAARHLPARWRWTEEYYSFDPRPGGDSRVVLRLDEDGLRLEPRLRMGDDHPIAWWRCEGRARVFYSALGHQAEAWSDPAHLGLLDGAMAWAARADGEGCD